MPRYVARRVLLAPLEDVWAFLAEPYHLSDWWPGISGVQPDRRGLAAGARWQVIGPNQPSWFRKPQMAGALLVLEARPPERLAFQLVNERIDAGLDLRSLGPGKTEAILTVEAPLLTAVRRSFPTRALGRLYDLVQTAAEPG